MRSGGRAGSDHDVQCNVLSPNWNRLRQALKQTVANDDEVRQSAAARKAAPLKMVLNFAEITNRKHIENLQVLFIYIVDLMLGIGRN